MPGDNAVAEILLLVKTEIARTVDDKLVEFFKASVVQKEFDPLAGGHLAARSLLVYPGLAAAEFGLSRLFSETLEFIYRTFFGFHRLRANLLTRHFNVIRTPSNFAFRLQTLPFGDRNTAEMTRILQIDSRDNPRVKEARRVRDGREDDKIFLEGVRLIREAIQSQLPIECLFLSNEGRTRAAGLVEAARATDNFQLSNSAFESISDTVTSQGVIALARRPESGVARIGGLLSIATVPLVVFLSRTNNPSNLGAVARAVEAAGACGLIVSRGSADAFSPKALRASMGSSFRLPIWSEVDLGEALQWATKNDLQTVATQVGAERS